MAARIRPSLDDSSLLRHVSMSIESLFEIQMSTTTATSTNGSEITPCVDDVAVAINNNNFNSEERFNGRDFLLKRSYSFGFEQSLASERMVMEAVMASPWWYKRGSFWSKQSSPFGSLTKSRVF
ncbi:RING-H2 finger protein ATL65 [Citrus sinensis]|nr:RING-H2 finger protein ATL65 [Citrus sinensis]